jgi:hypothetical protein
MQILCEVFEYIRVMANNRFYFFMDIYDALIS